MARVHLVIGPVGAGKSTYATALARELRAARFDLDAWMASLFRPDRPQGATQAEIIAWYTARVARCIDVIWLQAARTGEAGTDVVLELGLIRRADREPFFAQVDASGHTLVLHLLDAPREVRWARVEQRNTQRGATFSMEVPFAVFEVASDLWEPLDDVETEGREVYGHVTEW